MRKVARLIQEWMLPCAIVLGISLYLLYRVTPWMHGMGPWLHPVVSEGQRVVIALLLFFQFVKISPHDIKLSRWHLGALAVQVLSFLALAAGVSTTASASTPKLSTCTSSAPQCQRLNLRSWGDIFTNWKNSSTAMTQRCDSEQSGCSHQPAACSAGV